MMAESATNTSGPRSRRWFRAAFELIDDEPSAEQRAAARKVARTLFRVYCIACGRSSEGASAPARLSRCENCGGTMLVEPVAA
jgi:hypothetical protein